jgi:hypothetical protein
VKRIVGAVNTRLTVREDLAVQGTLQAGATIAPGCTLLVHGDVRGTVTLGPNSRFLLGGTFGAFVDDNQGTLSLAGVVATPVETIPGTLLVAANSAVTVAGRTRLLDPHGSLHSILDLLEIPLSLSSALRWNATTASFGPVPSEDFVELAELVWTDRGE